MEDLRDKQRAIEYDCLHMIENKTQSIINDAKKHHYNHHDAIIYFNLIDAFAKRIMLKIEYLNNFNNNNRFIRCDYLHEFKLLAPHDLSYIVINSVLANIYENNISRSTITSMIKDKLESQLILKQTYKDRNKLEYAKSVNIRAKKENYVYKNSARYNKKYTNPSYRFRKTLKKLVAEYVSGYTKKMLNKVSSVLLELFIDTTGFLQQYKTSKTKSALRPTKRYHDYFKNSVKTALTHSININNYKPMIIKPRKWGHNTTGGYLITPNIRLIKNKITASNVNNKSDINNIYSALNTLQSTKYKVNKNVFDVFDELVNNKSLLADLPDQNVIDAEPTSYNSYQHISYIEYKIKNTSKSLQVLRIQKLLKEFREYEEFYYPCNLDNRGRFYTICNISHINNDICRGCIEFSEAKELESETAVYWLAIHGANQTSISKASFNDRYKFIIDNTACIVDIANNPFNNTSWQSSISNIDIKKPWQFLAFCFEWAGYIKHGLSFKSSLPIVLDATCSGIQHYSALLLDKTTAKNVNMLASNYDATPEDIYNIILKEVLEKLKNDMLNGTADELIQAEKGREYKRYGTTRLATDWLNWGVDRALIKTPVIALIYGSKTFSIADKLATVIKEQKIKNYNANDTSYKTNVLDICTGNLPYNYLAGVIISVAKEVLAPLFVVSKFLKKCLTVVFNNSKDTIGWKTINNFIVHHSYNKNKSSYITDYTTFKKISYYQEQGYKRKKVDHNKNNSAISANFIHSLDATHLTNVVNRLKTYGITDIVAVHDCIGVHASNVERMNKIIRNEFVKLYSVDQLELFRQSLAEYTDIDVNLLPEVPKKSGLDLKEIKQSKYFFS